MRDDALLSGCVLVVCARDACNIVVDLLRLRPDLVRHGKHRSNRSGLADTAVRDGPVRDEIGADVRVEEIFVDAIPFIVMILIALAIVIAFPPLSTWLPSRM